MDDCDWKSLEQLDGFTWINMELNCYGAFLCFTTLKDQSYQMSWLQQAQYLSDKEQNLKPVYISLFVRQHQIAICERGATGKYPK